MADPAIEVTPTQPEVTSPEVTSKTDDDVDGIVSLTYVKTEESAPTGVQLHTKLAHLLGVVVAGVIALLVSAVLADGRSVIALKPVKELNRITLPSLKEKGLDYRADELLGPTYGVGLHHDSSGYSWTEIGAEDTLQKYVDELGLHQVIAAVPAVIAQDGLKHPAAFLDCKQLINTGLSAMSLGIIAEVASALLIIFHGLALVGLFHKTGISAKVGKAMAVLSWFTLTAGFLIVICLALVVMDNTWKCDNPFIPEIKLSDHFHFTYGLGLAYAGYVSSLLTLIAMVFFTSTTDGVDGGAPPPAGAATKSLGGVAIGLVTCAVVSLAVAGGENAFKDNDYMYHDPAANPCEGQKPTHAGPADHYFKNVDCMKDGITQVLEQAGANVTRGYKGGLDAGEWRTPITKPYDQTDLCPVNVHWHLGAEHLSVGQFDEKGKGPVKKHHDAHTDDSYSRRELAAGQDIRLGYQCHWYDETDKRFDDTYEWKYCTDMHVGETYEVHWPHSAAGECGTKWQYQSPFYDGVFCNDGIINILTPLNTYKNIGVQSQVFTIVNDESYYHGNLFDGMIVSPVFGHGQDIAMYTGSTTGTSRDNEMCSRYAPITWQVDRKCHLISASSFDAMCKKMLEQADDMSGDVYPHGARELVATKFVANNQQS